MFSCKKVGSLLFVFATAALFSEPGAAWDTATLPAPFSSWNVEVESFERDGDPQYLRLSFDSQALRLRSESVVLLPDTYFRTDGARLGTTYFLHGTNYIDRYPVTAVLDVVDPANLKPRLQPSGGYDKRGLGFNANLDRMEFVVVFADANWPQWCPHCWWVDGKNGQGVAAESHLYGELIPLVEALFNVRTDRGGRALLGHSMGGIAALIHGLRHPDRFAFIGASGASISSELGQQQRQAIYWQSYLRSQGYEPGDEIAYRNIDIATLAPQAVGIDLQFVSVVGDGCVTRTDGACTGQTPTYPEFQYRTATDQSSPRLDEIGLPYFYVRREGEHSSHLADTFQRLFLPRINRTFASNVAAPSVFSYKTVDRAFTIWDYSFAVSRPNDEFLNILGARTDGSTFTLAGTGSVVVTTPPAFEPGQEYLVEVSPNDGKDASVTTLTAGADGRLVIALQLGPTRTIDERVALLDSTQFLFPHTRVDIILPRGKRDHPPHPPHPPHPAHP